MKKFYALIVGKQNFFIFFYSKQAHMME